MPAAHPFAAALSPAGQQVHLLQHLLFLLPVRFPAVQWFPVPDYTHSIQ